ncbi:Uncharacterised protein [Vibrio cholerae]|uniref:Uncharacterized protein n=1 Tax=Vibrio cholerae TaxID=666 RepID=A0A656B0D7_VIBCL|nr:Uncharacterised protein [Vibrio cholerae]CRZ82191.1 Uncharacterised protein [Vibrio cholerae]CSB41664.1 Uncharacterised protein [Vibrio cholerae]CSB46685.1 Uncharacterised protein [Vibrio cholerae]CSB47522.1 Uncharacterised protein [Vibrio cholerae]
MLTSLIKRVLALFRIITRNIRRPIVVIGACFQYYTEGLIIFDDVFDTQCCGIHHTAHRATGIR